MPLVACGVVSIERASLGRFEGNEWYVDGGFCSATLFFPLTFFLFT